jgi:acetylornithine/succinyldiaminopimelate/putrescine aminotransferase
MVWQEALGGNVLDVDGNLFLDLTAGFGVAAAGHRPAPVVRAAARQSELLVHGLGDVFSHPTRVALAERLVALAPLPDPRVYFAISGADAVEIALKTARLHTNRRAILAFDPAYHGLTLGALRVTSRREFREPFACARNVQRASFGGALQPIEDLLRRGNFGAVVVEPIVGREGVLLPPRGWLAELAACARRHGSLLILDEIYVGFGRTGPWFVAQEEEVVPDLLCCGKALGGGWPIAAVIGRSEVLSAWRCDGEARHTATFVAHPVACAAALATLDLLAELIPGGAARVANAWQPLFDEARSQGFVVRGRGALWGLQGPRAKALQVELLGRGIITLAGGPSGDVLQLSPPLNLAERQLSAVVALGLEALAALDSGP